MFCMTMHRPHLGSLTILMLAITVSLPVDARLRDAPVKNLVIDGEWQLDVENSDDPQDVIDDIREASNKRTDSHSGGMNNGGHGSRGSGGRHGGNHSGTAGNSGSQQSEPSSRDNNQAALKSLTNEIGINSTKLTMHTVQHGLNVISDADATQCEVGDKISIIDTTGTGERHCGWDDRAWVVETAYEHSFTRNDRYEVSKDNKQLTYTTKISGGGLPAIVLKRTYSVITPAVPPS
jgi:hypothetical protein